MFGASEGSKSRLAKAAGAEPSGQMRDQNLHAVVARSRVESQKVKSTPHPEQLLAVGIYKKCTPLWCEAHLEVLLLFTPACQTTFGSLDVQKSARRCGTKHISKSKCTKHLMLGALGSWAVEKVHAAVARSVFRSQNVQNTSCSEHFWKLSCWKRARRCGPKHIWKWKSQVEK